MTRSAIGRSTNAQLCVGIPSGRPRPIQSADVVEKFTGQPFPALNFIGGGAQSRLWCQVMADVLDRPIRQVEHPIRANARGAAALAALTLDRATLDDVASCVQVVETFQPDPSARAVYDELFREFRAIHKQTKGIYARLHGDG